MNQSTASVPHPQEAQHIRLAVLVASSTHHVLLAHWLRSQAECELVIPLRLLRYPARLATLPAAGLLFLN